MFDCTKLCACNGRNPLYALSKSYHILTDTHTHTHNTHKTQTHTHINTNTFLNSKNTQAYNTHNLVFLLPLLLLGRFSLCYDML
jgi:hypothetical protein